jgi:hypothetical protein
VPQGTGGSNYTSHQVVNLADPDTMRWVMQQAQKQIKINLPNISNSMDDENLRASGILALSTIAALAQQSESTRDLQLLMKASYVAQVCNVNISKGENGGGMEVVALFRWKECRPHFN